MPRFWHSAGRDTSASRVRDVQKSSTSRAVNSFEEKSFGYCDFKPRPEHRQAPTIASSNGANPWREFINLLGLDIMSSAYKSGMKKNHPDMGGDAAVAAKLNMLWDALKGELK